MQKEIRNNGDASITFTIDNMQITLDAGKSVPITSERAIRQFEALKQRSRMLSDVVVVDLSVQNRVKATMAQSKLSQEQADAIRAKAQEEAQKKVKEQQEAIKKAEEEKAAAEKAKKEVEAKARQEEEQKKAAQAAAEKAQEDAKKQEEAKAAEQKQEQEKQELSKVEARRKAKEEAAKLTEAMKAEQTENK